jgi:thiamine biosynthesis lipoprotein
MKRWARSFLVACLCVFPGAAWPAFHQVREVHYQMGTFLELTVWHEEPELAKRVIREGVREVHRLEEILSNFDPSSSVSKLNRQAGSGAMSVAAELFEVLEIAKRFSDLTAGDFDVTVGPLMELWRDAGTLGRLPDQKLLQAALGRVGYEKLELYAGREAQLRVAGMNIDLGGIGKGYAVDRAAAKLKAAGIRSALINFGGSSMLALGAPPAQRGWRIALQTPGGAALGVIELRDTALSTSGSMGKFWTIGGQRYGHMIDPKSGMPVLAPRTAMAVASSATAAEALTKPLVLRGAAALPLIARFAGAEAVVVGESGAPSFSRGFKSKLHWQGLPGA